MSCLGTNPFGAQQNLLVLRCTSLVRIVDDGSRSNGVNILPWETVFDRAGEDALYQEYGLRADLIASGLAMYVGAEINPAEDVTSTVLST